MKETNGDVLKKDKESKKVSSNPCMGLCLFVVLYLVSIFGVGIATRLLCGKECLKPSVQPSPSIQPCQTINKSLPRKKKRFRFFQSKNGNDEVHDDVKQESTEIVVASSCESSVCNFCSKVLAALLSPYALTTLPHQSTQTQTQTCPTPDEETSEESHKAGPLKHVVDRAASFFKRKQKHHPKTKTKQTDQKHIESLWGPDAITLSNAAYTPQQQSVTQKLSSRVQSTLESMQTQNTHDYNTRLKNVYWGSGSHQSSATPHNPSFPWWFPSNNDVNAKPSKYSPPSPMNQIEGSALLNAYLKIMEWPQDLHTTFPYKLCSKGCDAEQSPAHTLEWREKYKPWCVSPSLIQENSIGWIYHRGYAHGDSANSDDTTNDTTNINNNNDVGGHSMIWYRPGMYQVSDPEFYTRNIIHTLDAAIAETLQRTHGNVGKYNIVLDCHKFSFAMMPRIHDVKRGMVMMQDHFPDRLGVLLLANLSGPAQLFLKVITPFITEKVRNKIHALPNDPKQRMDSLRVLIDDDMIPDWLGGSDTYKFDKKDRFKDAVMCSDEELLEYLTTMPYHA